MNPLDWVGLVLALAVLAVYAAIAGCVILAAGRRLRRRYRLRELADLERGDIDPDWEQVRQTLGHQPDK